MVKKTRRINKTMYCVVMGDIVQSKELDFDVKETVKQTLEDTLIRINAKYTDLILASFGPVRGDAFEGVLFTCRYAPRIVQEIIKSMYRIENTKVRISVVRGKLDRVDSDRNKADGPAFHQANKMIEQIKNRHSEHWMQFSLATNTKAQPIINSFLSLLSTLTESWTERQTEVAWVMDEHSAQQSLAGRELNISRSVINKQIKASNYYVYRQAWIDLEEYLAAEEEKEKDEIGFTAYYSLAKSKAKQHDNEATFLFLKAVELAKAELGEQDFVLSILYNGLAESYIAEKRYDEAESTIKTSFEIQDKYPKARLEYAKTLALEGSLMLELNKGKTALRKYKQALQTAMDTVGENHPFIYACHYEMALVHKRMKEYDAALDNFSFILAHCDDNSLAYADVLYNMALCCQLAHNYKKALGYAGEALEIRRKYLPLNNKGILKIVESIEEMGEER